MLTNLLIISTLRDLGYPNGQVHRDSDTARTIRIPDATINMTGAAEIASALTNAGIDVFGYGVNTASTHDTFIGMSIMVHVESATQARRQQLKAAV